MTEQKDITASEKRLRAVFDHAFDAMVLIDDSGAYVDANPAALKLLGTDLAELRKRRFGDFTPGADKERMDNALKSLRAGTLGGDWTLVSADGVTRQIEFCCVANILPGLHLIISKDVTARKAAEQSLGELSRRLVQLRDDERSRIGLQLHETTAQNLAATRLQLLRVKGTPAAADPVVSEVLDEILELTDQSIAEIRTLSYVLHPPMLDEKGLFACLRSYVRGFEARAGIVTKLELPEETGRLPQEVETAVFRMVQEALTNIHRHSGSTTATIAIEREPGQLRICVLDHGSGMPDVLRENAHTMRAAGVGLAGIEERARELGGTMRIDSDVDGTRVQVSLPITEA
jgi:PAS domain S-box-containing protein